MLWLGISGFSYKDWIGVFYPPGLPQRSWLRFYAREFPTLELNVTFYRVPTEKAVASWVESTPDNFCFTVKIFRGFTHERTEASTSDQAYSTFTASLQPMIDAGKLGCLLAQFPYSFAPTPENRDYLRRVREGLGALPAVVEFRNAAWVSQGTFDLLRSLDFGFVCVDEPRLKGLLPPTIVATASTAYVRFHGRNAAAWYKQQAPGERYGYRYTDEELREWLPGLQRLQADAENVYVFFNNTIAGNAILNARQLRALLDAV